MHKLHTTQHNLNTHCDGLDITVLLRSLMLYQLTIQQHSEEDRGRV